MWYYLYANLLSNNLNTDLQILEEQPYHRIKLLKSKGSQAQCNTFEQQIQKNFDTAHLTKRNRQQHNIQGKDEEDEESVGGQTD